MNIFKISYKVVRENSDEIYKGFGFKHHSDATQYYVHPNNQSHSGTTTLCQPIGEALSLFTSLISSIINGNTSIEGDYFVSDDGNQVFFTIDVPHDWRQNEVVEKSIFRYEAHYKGDEITIAAYDEVGRWIDGNMEHLRPLYKLLPCFCILLARECRLDNDYQTVLHRYVEAPAADIFVNLHEDFYQAHKFDEHEVIYANLSGFDTGDLMSFKDGYKVISENIASTKQDKEISIVKFEEDAFLPEYRELSVFTVSRVLFERNRREYKHKRS